MRIFLLLWRIGCLGIGTIIADAAGIVKNYLLQIYLLAFKSAPPFAQKNSTI